MTIRSVLEDNRAICLDDDDDLERLHDALVEEVVRVADKAVRKRWYDRGVNNDMFWFFWLLMTDKQPFPEDIKKLVDAKKEKIRGKV